MKIVIDQGHGGKDPGAAGCGLAEADLTGQLGLIVKEKLAGYDADVLLAPRGTLVERTAFANSAKADLFVSIHVNAGGGTGYETHVHPGASAKTVALATAIHKILGSFYSGYGFTDRGLRRSNFAVLRKTNMPAVLLENLFIDNPGDAAFLRENLMTIGNEIAWAIASALQLKAPEISSGLSDILKHLSMIEAEVGRLRQIIAKLESLKEKCN